MIGVIITIIVIVVLLRLLGFKNKHVTTVRPGVGKFVAWALGALLLFIVALFTGSYFGWIK
jgi:hypothetical protein